MQSSVIVMVLTRRQLGGSLAALAIAGCRLNKLPKYYSRLEKAALLVDVDGPGVVRVHGGDGRASSDLHKLVGIAAKIAKSAIGLKLQARLREIMPPERIGAIAGEVLAQRFGELGLEHAPLAESPNTRIEFQVRSFGIYSSGDHDPADYGFTFRALVFYIRPKRRRPKKIWRIRRSFSARVSDVHVSLPSNSLVGDISTAVALNNLEPPVLEAVLIGLVRNGANHFVDQLSLDIAQAKHLQG